MATNSALGRKHLLALACKPDDANQLCLMKKGDMKLSGSVYVCRMLLLTVNNFVTPVESTKANMGDLQSLVCMCTKCREQITACVQDPDCKAALDALSACSLNDQVRPLSLAPDKFADQA